MLKLLTFFLCLFFGISFLIPSDGFAQYAKNSFEINIQKSVRNFTAEQHALQGRIVGLEASYHFNVLGLRNSVLNSIGARTVDLSFGFKSMSNLSRSAAVGIAEFGDTYSVLGGLTWPILNFKRFDVEFAPAAGLLYAEESWFSNQNLIIGSKLNFAFRGGLKTNVYLSKNTAVSAGLSIFHFSNGAFRVPNNGLNIVDLSLGIKKGIGQELQVKTSMQNVLRKHSFDLGFNYGSRGAYQSKASLSRTGVYLGYNFRFKPYLSLGAGMDGVYYHDLYDVGQAGETYQGKGTSLNLIRVGASLGPDIWLGRLAIMVKYGYYLHYNSLHPVNTYWTAGGKYVICDWLALQAKAYIHQTEADYTGFGLIFTR